MYFSLYSFASVVLLSTLCIVSDAGVSPDEEVPFESCSSSSTVARVLVSGCNREQVCAFHVNQEHSIAMDFVPETEHEQLSANLKVDLLSMVSLEPVQNAQVCEHGIQCPVEAGVETRFESTETITVPWWLPKAVLAQVTLTASLHDTDTEEMVACVRLNVTIQD